MNTVAVPITAQQPGENSGLTEVPGNRQQLCIRIADLTISATCDDATLTLSTQPTMERFSVAPVLEPDVRLRIGVRDLTDLKDLNESSMGQLLFDSGGVWQLYDEGPSYRILFHSALLGPKPYKVARFQKDWTCGQVWLHSPYFSSDQSIAPLEYPLDELLMMQLLGQGRGVEIHACGLVDERGRGLLFAGQSGAGKTTSARLWQQATKTTVLSDDRIIIRYIHNQFWMYGTPWHGEAGLATPCRVPLCNIYFLGRGKTNALVPQAPTAAIGRLFACSFPPFYNQAALTFSLHFLEQLTRTIPCAELRFVPDASAVAFVQQRSADG